jgi:putative FmdB family regulatory protein
MTKARYDYRCTVCERVEEFFELRDREPYRECQRCLAVMRRLPSAVGTVYKTGGFYSVDSRNKPS